MAMGTELQKLAQKENWLLRQLHNQRYMAPRLARELYYCIGDYTVPYPDTNEYTREIQVGIQAIRLKQLTRNPKLLDTWHKEALVEHYWYTEFANLP